MRHKRVFNTYTHPHSGAEITLEACSVCRAEGMELTTDCPGKVTTSVQRCEVCDLIRDYTDGLGWFYHQRPPRPIPRFDDHEDL